MTISHNCSVVTFGNFKGGTGKTTNSSMLAYALSEMGYKVLLSDQDPQANATGLFIKTKANLSGELFEFEDTLMTAIRNEDLSSIVMEVKENLYLLPSFSDFFLYPNFLEQKFPDSKNPTARVQHFSSLLEPLKKDYDFIFIDVPPTISIISDSALYASDFVVVVMQTHEWSLNGAEIFMDYLLSLIRNYGADLELIGVLPVLLKNGAGTDLLTLDKAKETFGEDQLFKYVVKNMERLKRFSIEGITDNDMHDRRVHKAYREIAEEFLVRHQEELERVTN